jgi:hypothetical protein
MDWYRWWHGSANDPKLRMIAADCSMPLACVVGVWAYILECASGNHVRGQIDNFDYEVVSFHLGIDVETPCNAMKRRRMLHETGETLVVCNWDKWQPKRERDDVSTDRVKKFRDKQKQALTERNANETPCNANETHVTPREEKRREDIKEVNPLVVSKLTQCPQQEIISIYGSVLPSLPQPRVWEGARAKNLQARWKWVLADLEKKGKPATKQDGLDFFERMFAYIASSDFLTGKTSSWTGCDLAWIVNAENFAKIIEGRYENKEAA